ncbi:hypothetical protein ONZ45_g6946 [Pleurotus djamor]|nr:hypothetical protein ONZ45_g6946 [Pleurotus djamor]
MNEPPSDQCALRPDGSLKDASEIEWSYDVDDKVVPMESAQEGRSRRAKPSDKYREAILAEQADDDGVVRPQKASKPRRSHHQKTRKQHPLLDPAVSGEESVSSDFSSNNDSFDSDSEPDAEVSNSELADSLPAKTRPATKTAKAASHARQAASKRKQANPSIRDPSVDKPPPKRPAVTVEEVDDDDDDPVCNDANHAPSGAQSKAAASSGRRNPIYHFYEEVPVGADGRSNVGDKHFKCYHGHRKILTITKAMRYSLNGLTGHLKTHFPAMYRLYLVLKFRTTGPTDSEIAIAHAETVLDAETAATYVSSLEQASENIVAAFNRQATQAKGPWDQDKFEELLAKWIIACDQPFDEVDKPEFRQLLEYTHHPSPNPLHVPHRTAVRNRVMKMGEETVRNIKKMFKDLQAKVHISLDMWTSSNQYAFLCILAHYITNDEEIMIDFRELKGDHSGENMAEAVWDTLVFYDLTTRVMAFVMDNASNNDTMMKALERRFHEAGIEFSATDARLRSDSRNATYQDCVTAPLSREHDEDHAIDEDEDMDGSEFPAVDKLRRIVRVVRSSPQRRQSWLDEVHKALEQANSTDLALMLILDVKTRWSSTHQMLRRALDYKESVTAFVERFWRDLSKYELTENDWTTISLVTSWLKSFRSATTEMSTTKQPMISTTLAIFRGLQDHLKDIIRSLPNTTSPQLKAALIASHQKLSDYYFKYDESPYYTWAALLDPRIGYERLREDYHDDQDLLDYLEDSKKNLHDFFRSRYAHHGTSSSATTTTTSLSKARPARPQQSPQKVNFTKRYQQTERPDADQLLDFFKVPQENFDHCDPIKWWVGRKSQFPDLFRLARDILSIPGSAVAVERVFSGGRDTISLRRASLKPETIRTLMLVKQHLRLARTAVREVLGSL